MNGVPGSSSTTGTSVSLGGAYNGNGSNGQYFNGSNGQYRPRINGLANNGMGSNGFGGSIGNQNGGSNMYLHTNGNGPTVESSNMLISTMATPPSGNVTRPAAGRGYNKSFWRNLQLHHFWLPL